MKYIIFTLAIVFVVGVYFILGGAFNHMSNQQPKILGATFPAENYEISAYFWESSDYFSNQNLDEFLNFTQSQGINSIYLSVDEYVDITEIKNVNSRNEKLSTYDNYLNNFLTEAGRNGIKVYALSGNKDWASKDLNYIPKMITDYVISYNNNPTHNIKFAGLNFDIEPYSLNNFDTQKVKILTDYLNLASWMVDRIKNSTQNNLSLGFSVPYWFDNENGTVPDFVWSDNGKKAVGYHLMDILNKLQNSFLSIMDYRNFTGGMDGSIQHAEDEIRYADVNAKNVKIIIAQETTKQDIAKTSFYGKSRTELKLAAVDISNYFVKDPSFGGIAIHQLLSYKSLPE
ncbi:MAG TPA: hypothetical protein VFX17_02360 [Patescibacteria group bacterium]|nr:hypothetical protein [Patescibacteria group bacterium]